MPVPLPVIPRVFRCALRWQHTNGQTAVNVIHLKATVDGAAPAAVFESIADTVSAAMFDQLSSGASIASVDITPLDGISATSSFITGSGAVWSGASGGVTAPSVAVIVKVQTGLRGRNKRGRVFLPFIVGAAVDDGFLASAEATSMTAAWLAWAVAIGVDADTPMIFGVAAYDRRHAGVGAGFQPYSNIIVERPLGSQRRRQGRNRGA